MPHLNAIREMVKNSATDRRTMSKMDDAIFDLDKLVSSIAFRKDHHECKVRSVQNTVRALKPIVQRVRSMEANSSSHFKDAHASEMPCEMRQHFGRTVRRSKSNSFGRSGHRFEEPLRRRHEHPQRKLFRCYH